MHREVEQSRHGARHLRGVSRLRNSRLRSTTRVDRGNRKIACPVLFLWRQRSALAKLYDDPLSIWKQWADDVRGGPVPVGHFIPEEAPEETTRRLLDFLR